MDQKFSIRKLSAFIFFLGGFCFHSFSQTFPELQFKHLTTQNGLSSDIVNSITEDKTGFIWMATINGLNRYDGYRVKQYFHDDKDSNSLINNAIHFVQCDSKGRLWIATDFGLSCFLTDENRFINYSEKSVHSHRLKRNSTGQVFEDKDGSIWIMNQQGFILKVENDMSLREIKISSSDFKYHGMPMNGYAAMFRDHNGNEWAYMTNRIYHINEKTKQPLQSYDFSKQLNYGVINDMYQTGDGTIWIATWGAGIWKFNSVKGTIDLVSSSAKETFSTLKEWNYNNQSLVLSTGIYSGFYLLDEKSSAAKKLVWNIYDPFSLQGDVFTNFYIDHHSNLWICTNHGVNYAETGKKIFNVFPITEPGTLNYQQGKNGSVFSYYEDDKNVWLTKRGTSTFWYDKEMKLQKIFTSLYPLSSTDVHWKMNAYYFFQKGNEWYLPTDSGLVVYNAKTQTSQLYLPEQFIQNSEMRTIIPLNDGEIMIRSYHSGIFVFNTGTKKFSKYYKNDDNSPEGLPAVVNYLFKTKSGDIYATGGNKKPFLKYSKVKDQFEVINISNAKDYFFDEVNLFGMDESTDGKLWLTSNNGVYLYNPANNKIEAHYTVDGKLGTTFRICFDNYQNVWVNASSGIWCYLISKSKWINFSAMDGLPGSDFESIIVKKRNGEVLAGLEGAIAVFHPDKLNAINNDAPAIITEAFVENKNLSFPLLNNSNKKLTIQPGQNSFSIDFALLDYYNATSAQYLYKLEPLMNDFQNNINGHINFNGLSPGHYTLYVKGADKAGNVYSKKDKLEIIVQPYWYQTNSFKLIAVLVFAGLVFFLVNRRIKNIQKQSSLKERIAETEMQALRAQMNPHFIFNCLNSIENFIMKNEKRLASDYLNKFARLIRMILDSSRNELVPVAKDMEALQLYIDMEQLRFQNKFTYSSSIDPSLLNGDYHVPSLLIQPYVENAIVHGLAHSQNENLYLHVTTHLENEKIKYVIQDNGVGRKQAIEYKQKNKPNHKSVGLKITEDRINIFNKQKVTNGSIVITDLFDENKKPAGTKVEITIKAS